MIVAACATVDAASLPRPDVDTVLQRPLRSSSVATALANCLQGIAGTVRQNRHPVVTPVQV